MGQEDQEPIESRPPTTEDFVELCRSLNANGVDYIVIGGMAVIEHGYMRATEDIDLLVSAEKENEARLYNALLVLADQTRHTNAAAKLTGE